MRRNCTCSAGGAEEVYNALRKAGGKSEFCKVEYGRKPVQTVKYMQLDEEIKKRFKLLMKEIYSAENKADVFMSATNQLKEAYV